MFSGTLEIAQGQNGAEKTSDQAIPLLMRNKHDEKLDVDARAEEVTI